MGNSVESGARAWIGKYQISEDFSVERAVVGEDASAERCHDGGKPFGAFGDDGAGDLVRIDHRNPAGTKTCANCAFS
jgi:hypothetical protein